MFLLSVCGVFGVTQLWFMFGLYFSSFAAVGDLWYVIHSYTSYFDRIF